MTKPIEIEIKATDASDISALRLENEKLRRLLEAAELRESVRFSMIDISGDVLVLTTSNDLATEYERRMFACFARAWADSHMAWKAGQARGGEEIATKAWGEDRSRWPESVRHFVDARAESASEASVMSAELTRLAMAPFGVMLARSLDDGNIWCEAKSARAAESGRG